MSPARSLLAFFRRPLSREIGLHLGLLAVLLQIGLAVLHVAPSFAHAIGGPALEAAWCGTPEHTPAVPAEANAGGVCPLCQLPPIGPVPAAVSDTILPVVWSAEAIVYFRDAVPAAPGYFIRSVRPRGPPPSA